MSDMASHITMDELRSILCNYLKEFKDFETSVDDLLHSVSNLEMTFYLNDVKRTIDEGMEACRNAIRCKTEQTPYQKWKVQRDASYLLHTLKPRLDYVISVLLK